jgi:hypothetical protein
MEHRSVFEAAGYDFRRFRRETVFEFGEFHNLRMQIAIAFRPQRERRVLSIGPLARFAAGRDFVDKISLAGY